MSFEKKLEEYAKETIGRDKEFKIIYNAIFVKHDNMYELYFPCQCDAHEYDFSKGLVHVCSNVERFLFDRENKMLLIKETSWIPIYCDYFTWYLNTQRARDRLLDTPRIVSSNSEAIILEKFILNYCMVQIEGGIYLINQEINISVKGSKSGVKVERIKGTIEAVNKKEFLVIDNEKQYIRTIGGKVTFGPSTSIEKIAEYGGDTGYFAKDENGNIEGIKTRGYQIKFKPATKVKFAKRIIMQNEIIEIWMIRYENGNVEIVCQTLGKGQEIFQI